jgi:hypothetical protein
VEEFIAPVILLIVLFVGFGLAHRRGQRAPGCSGCTSCADESECTKKDRDLGPENHFLEK